MIGEVTGIRRIRMLYLELLYRCNFECLYCFHGKRLQHADAFTADEAINLLTLMREQYGTEAVTLLGGEPFVYKDLTQVVRYAKQELGMQVETCTNGYRIERRLTEIAAHLDLLRVSLEGIGSTNDHIRKFGSYQSALSALDIARGLGVRTGATMTVTSRNIDEVLPLARTLQRYGVEQVAFDFDTWPDLPTFVEIEGPDEASVRQAAVLLDLDYSEARFGSVDEIYKSESGRDILAEPTLLFADACKKGEDRVAVQGE